MRASVCQCVCFRSVAPCAFTSPQHIRNVRLQPLTLDEVCTSLGILDDVGIVKMEGKRDMMKRMVSRLAHAWRENCGQFREAGAMLCVAGLMLFILRARWHV